jgi:large subunit ribosomal protein L22
MSLKSIKKAQFQEQQQALQPTQAKAVLSSLRISPRKVQIVLDLIRNKSFDEAYAILKYTPKAASQPLLKLLLSAQANALNNHYMDGANLYVAVCYATPGKIIKRIMPRAQGRAFRINKRTSHVTIILRERSN